MRIGIPFDVPVTIIQRYDFTHLSKKIRLDIPIRIFVDGYTRCGMGNVYNNHSVEQSPVLYQFSDPGRYVDNFLLISCFYVYFHMLHSFSVSLELRFKKPQEKLPEATLCQFKILLDGNRVTHYPSRDVGKNLVHIM